MKKILALTLALMMALSLVACGNSSSTADANNDADTSGADSSVTAEENNAGDESVADQETGDADAETVTLKVAASPTPHAEILEQVKPILAEEGIELIITEYDDYVVPNTAVDEGEEDANYFQHQPYLDSFNEQYGTSLVSVGSVHYEPFGIYPCLTASLDELQDGAKVAVPNDVTNEARALLLLQDAGLITLRADAGLEATTNDIEENPKNLEFVELEAAMVANVTSEVDIAAINGNYALQAGFSSAADAIVIEDAESEAAQTYANIIAVAEGNQDDPRIQALVEALQSDTIRQYITDTYEGNVLPIS